MNSNYVFHHLGIATRSIEKCADIYCKLGYSLSDVKVEPTQNVKIGFLSKKESPLIELVEPLNNDAPVSSIVKNSGTTPYHTCYEVEDLQKSLDEFEELNFRLLFEPIKAEAMDDGLFCYLFSVEIGLIELYQRKKE
ncbi:MAG TPA: VOC family protein [Ignavibacteria bacterium]